jgi:3-oxoacid CoA-transferase B subunit
MSESVAVKIDPREKIARRVALEMKDGQLVNLGIGLPTQVADYIPDDVNVILQSENGMTGMIGLNGKEQDDYITDAGGKYVSITEEGAFFDACYSFSLIRGGHVDTTVLGSLQVDQEGNIANYMIPNKLVPGMGGAMDLVTGAKKVIVAMVHTAKGEKRILKRCNLPLTGIKCVDLIVTEKAVFEVKGDHLLLKEVASESSIEEILELTDADIKIDENIVEF